MDLFHMKMLDILFIVVGCGLNFIGLALAYVTSMPSLYIIFLVSSLAILYMVSKKTI